MCGRFFSRFATMHERDRRTDTVRRHKPRFCITSRGKISKIALAAVID